MDKKIVLTTLSNTFMFVSVWFFTTCSVVGFIALWIFIDVNFFGGQVKILMPEYPAKVDYNYTYDPCPINWKADGKQKGH